MEWKGAVGLSADLAAKSDEQLAKLLAETELPEGEEINNSSLQRAIVYDMKVDAQGRVGAQRWADVCLLAAVFVDNACRRQVSALAIPVETMNYTQYRERTAALLIEEANGLRRVPGNWNVDEVRKLLGDALTGIAMLPDIPRKTRLLELHSYHGGIVYHDTGDYAKAAECQDMTAKLASDPFKKAIAVAMAALARVNQKLVESDEDAHSSVERMALRGAVDELCGTECVDAEFKAQWVANARLHLAWLDGQERDDVGEAVRACKALPDKLKPSFGAALGCVVAVIAEEDSAFWIANRIGYDLKIHPDWRGAALLILAGILDCNDGPAVKAVLRAVVDMPGYGGHVARAFARRYLDGLAANGE